MDKHDKVKFTFEAEMKLRALTSELLIEIQAASKAGLSAELEALIKLAFKAGYQFRAQESDSELATLLEALQFYADRASYTQGICFSEENLLIQDDLSHIDGHLVGGKKARESLTSFHRNRGWKN